MVIWLFSASFASLVWIWKSLEPFILTNLKLSKLKIQNWLTKYLLAKCERCKIDDISNERHTSYLSFRHNRTTGNMVRQFNRFYGINSILKIMKLGVQSTYAQKIAESRFDNVVNLRSPQFFRIDRRIPQNSHLHNCLVAVNEFGNAIDLNDSIDTIKRKTKDFFHSLRESRFG